MRNTHCIGRNGRSSRHGCVFLKSPAWEIDPYRRNTTERVRFPSLLKSGMRNHYDAVFSLMVATRR